MDAAKDVHISRETFLRSIVPIGLLFSGSLILSNKAYLYLSVHYIQMLKAFNPFTIRLRTQEVNRKLALIVVLVSCAHKNKLHCNFTDMITQVAAVAVRACLPVSDPVSR